MFTTSPLKTFRPDGYHSGFYQKYWNIVGNKVVEFVRRVWEYPSVIVEVNQTDVYLIPKVHVPQMVGQLCHISIYNSNYKVVNQVVVNRLRESS